MPNRYCKTCKTETEHDEAYEDRFDPGSWTGHYQVSAGLYCVECGEDAEDEYADYTGPIVEGFGDTE